MPTWSVIIPARNEAETLPALLLALKAQRLQPTEIIVVDNASSDATAQVAAGHGARVLHCAERGVAHARQMGLEAATGEWIATTDADSVPESDWLWALDQAALPARQGQPTGRTAERPGLPGLSGRHGGPGPSQLRRGQHGLLAHGSADGGRLRGRRGP